MTLHIALHDFRRYAIRYMTSHVTHYATVTLIRYRSHVFTLHLTLHLTLHMALQLHRATHDVAREVAREVERYDTPDVAPMLLAIEKRCET